MSLTYADKVEINRQNELAAYKERGIQILEESKKLVMDCDNLVKMKALITRCEKISKPRTGPGYDDHQKQYQKKKYQERKEETCRKLRQKRQKIQEVGQVDIGNFFNTVPM